MKGSLPQTSILSRFMPTTNVYVKGKQNVQDAHEAIRPSMPELTPDEAVARMRALCGDDLIDDIATHVDDLQSWAY